MRTVQPTERTWAILFRGDSFEPPPMVHEIAYIPDLSWFTVYFPKPDSEEERQQMERLVYSALARKEVSIFLVKIHPRALHFVTSKRVAGKAKRALSEAGLEVEVVSPCALVKVYASNMRAIPGIMGKLVDALQKSKVTIFATGDAYNFVGILVDQKDLERALSAAANCFFKDLHRATPFER
ncbi:MAG TPA: ACT domain-containing protein [Armatimonadetes bacterium]|nr:ACT domain-containing protein [Armatimonadota bacterium]